MNATDPNQIAGFREHEHTADWELEVWAPDLPGLLEQAARGMYQLAGMQLRPSPRIERRLEFPFSEAENLLIDFLSELLFLLEEQEIAFDEFSMHVADQVLIAELAGSPIDALNKEIKAVTYHGLEIRTRDLGFVVNIVFDV